MLGVDRCTTGVLWPPVCFTEPLAQAAAGMSSDEEAARLVTSLRVTLLSAADGFLATFHTYGRA